VASVVGRDAELSVLDGALGAERDGGAVILVGGPGIGKSTLWEAAVRSARGRGVRVLLARPSASEARLAFAGLIDLCDRLEPEALAVLPPPQRAALEAALLRAEAVGKPIASAAIAVGFLGVVRALAAHRRVLIALDDLPSLDSPSEEVLAFAARRLEGVDVRFLLARRPGRAGGLERELAVGLQRLTVGPLSLGAVRQLLFDRLGLSVTRQLMRRIMQATDGNPLFALEIGRSLVEHGAPSLGAEVPLPDSLEEMLGIRVARLSAPLRRVLLALALSEPLSAEQVTAVAGRVAVEDAVDAGVVLIDGQHVRASHPLLAAAVVKHSRAREPRELHL